MNTSEAVRTSTDRVHSSLRPVRLETSDQILHAVELGRREPGWQSLSSCCLTGAESHSFGSDRGQAVRVFRIGTNRRILSERPSRMESRESGATGGMLLGDALGCSISAEHPGRCGTTAMCGVCPINRAARVALAGKSFIATGVLLRNDAGQVEVSVNAEPSTDTPDTTAVITVTDIREQSRRTALERVFFHDLMNTVSGLRGLLDLLTPDSDPETRRPVLGAAIRRVDCIAEEIRGFKAVSEAEKGLLIPDFVTVSVEAFLNELVLPYQLEAQAAGCRLVVSKNSYIGDIHSDGMLMRRVLGNMIRNAIEASEENDTVTVGASEVGARVEFWVHNPGVMSALAKMQVFRRSFSTKGAGRGLGTYSMRLLGETILGGSVAFESRAETGTRFSFALPLDPHG